MDPAPPIVPLEEATDPTVVGTKAARLGQIMRRGFPVPAGVVVTAQPGWEVALIDRLPALGGGPYAVRSSAPAEDLTGASYAGLYESVLGVQGEQALLAAVVRCRNSSSSVRLGAYRRRLDIDDGPEPIPVLVHRQVEPMAAGVAMSVDPLTGDRDVTVIVAVRGLGDSVTGGRAQGDEWRVGPGGPVSTRISEGAVHAQEVEAIAAMVRAVAACLDHPQEVEWALVDGQVVILQTRPLTAVPRAVDWTPPLPGGWLRHFRLGEWLPGPVTPLFASWFLPLLEDRFASEQARDAGFRAPPPLHVVVNGWYFHSPFGTGTARSMVLGLLRRPRLALGSAVVPLWPGLTDLVLVGPQVRRWREHSLPGYRATVARVASESGDALPARLVTMVEELADAVGEQLWALVMVGGSAWKVEVPLARFWRRHLSSVGGNYQELLCALGPPPASLPAHAVLTLDWATPTLGESGLLPDPGEARPGHGPALTRRLALEAAATSALGPRRRRRFLALLGAAQHYARLREEQVANFTLAWPVLRSAVLSLGKHLVTEDVISDANDVFFLTREELVGSGDRRSRVLRRQAEWESNKRLAAPLVLGKPPAIFRRLVLEAIDGLRPPPRDGEAVLVMGLPGSPGRVTGPARVIRDPDELDRLRVGEILVVPLAAPVWTAAFARAAAVVSDGGSLAAHASLVAREYGIPAVVATGDATTRLRTGQVVTVDGTRGTVEAVGLH